MSNNFKLAKEEFFLFLVSIFIILVLITITWSTTNTNLALIILGFSPLILYVMLNIFHLEYSHQRHVVLFLSPIAIVGLFFLFHELGLFNASMDIISVSILNLFFSYLFSIFFHITTVHEKVEPQQPHTPTPNHMVHHHIEKGELEKPTR